MRIDILSLFPGMFYGPFAESIMARAIKNKLLEIEVKNLRDYAKDERGTVDDKPYGGGPGMLMKVEPLAEAVSDLRTEDTVTVLTSPRGEVFNQQVATELSREKRLLIVCGHYEGVDERIRQMDLIDREISIGDFILTSGNLAAMVICDAVARLLPGVLGSDQSSEDESFSHGLLEYPQYTRPPEFDGLKVPEVLLSGDHGLIERWRQEMAEAITARKRPDLYKKIKKDKL